MVAINRKLLEYEKQRRNDEITEENNNFSEATKSFLGEIGYNIITAPGAIQNFAVGTVKRLVPNTIKAVKDPNYSALDVLSDTYGADSWGNSWIEGADKLSKNLFGRKDWNELSNKEKGGRALGALVNPIKFKYIDKASKLNKAEILQKSNKTGEFTKFNNTKNIGSGTIRGPETQSLRGIGPTIKTSKYNKYRTGMYLLPGVQLEKNIPLSKQKMSMIVQGGLIESNYALMEYLTQKEQEEQQKYLERLVIDKRKNPNDPNNVITYDPYALDNVKLDGDEETNYLLPVLAGVATIYGGRKFWTKYGDKIKKELNYTDTATQTADPEALTGLSNKLDVQTKADIVGADRFAFRKTLVDSNMLSEEVANDLAVDNKTKINNMFDNVINESLDNKTYRQILNEFDALRATDLEQFTLLNEKFNLISKVQDDAFRNYEYLRKSNDPNTINYFNDTTLNKRSQPDLSYSNYNELNEIKNRIIEIDKTLSAKTKQIEKQINKAYSSMIDHQHKNNYISDRMYYDIKANRTDLNGNPYYKPIIRDNPDPFYRKISRLALDVEPYDSRFMPNTDMRGPQGIDPNTSKPFDQVYEQSIKNQMLKIEENNQKVRFIDDLMKHQKQKIEETLSDFDNILEEYQNKIRVLKDAGDIKAAKEYEDLYKDKVKKYSDTIKDLFTIRHIGSRDLNTNPHKITGATPMFNLGDPNYNPLHKLLNQYNTKSTYLMDKYGGNLDNAKDLISAIRNGRIDYYKVDQHIADAFNLNPTLPNKVFELLKASKSFVQSTITGKLNPSFAPAAFTMSMHEALTVFPVIAKELDLMDNASKFSYLKEVGKAMREQYISGQARDIADKFSKQLIANFDQMTPDERLLMQNNINTFEEKIKRLLKTQIEAFGGGSQKPLTKNNERFFTLNTKSKINDNIYKFLIKHDGIDGAVQKAKIIHYMQMALREGPQLGLTQYFGKLSGAIKNGEIVDPKTMKKVINVVFKDTANTGKQGTGKGIFGGLCKITSDYFTYGNIFIQSLAPKIRASGIFNGATNLYNLSMRLFDEKARMCDTLMLMKLHGNQLINNKFIQGLIFTSFIPTLLAYVWNHGSQNNINSYYQRSDYDKASKFMLMNFFGKDNHLYIPKDQEVAMIDSLLYTILDNIFGMSKYNQNDPGFEHSKVVMQSIARSLGVDSIPALDIIANVSGKDINLNPFDENFGVNDISRNKINSDLSETMYKNGIFNQETNALVNSIFGVLGSALLGSAEEYNVGSQNDTGLTDSLESFFDKYTKTAKLFGVKPVSTYNETSKTVYNKRNLINKIASVSIKNPNQQAIYDFVKVYNRNRIKPIHDKITKLRELINTARVTSKTKSGKTLDYNQRKNIIIEINKKLQLEFAKEYHEFDNLDKLIQARFGNGLTLENFMEKLND